MEHRVLSHLGLAARDYDVVIRRYIPAYEQMLATIVRLVSRLSTPYVVDLGAGTGALGAAIAEGVPTSHVRLLDIDPAMLEVAGARIAAFHARVELHRGAFEDPLPPCDAVVASLALHHIPERDRKVAMYTRIHAALRPGGVLLLGDATVDEAGRAHDEIYAQWTEHMLGQDFTRPEIEQCFAQWAGEDRYYPLRDELAMLREAGFAQPECFWKHGPMTVYGGYR